MKNIRIFTKSCFCVVTRRSKSSCTNILVLGILYFALTSCAYRFSNIHLHPPADIQNIAIEAIYDTSGITLPHHLLWGQLQEAFAVSGKVRVTPVNRAQAFLRAHIKKASLKQFENEIANKKVDPTVPLGTSTALPSSYSPPALSSFIDLNVATNYAKKEVLYTEVQIEIWDMRSKQLIMNKMYPISSVYKSFEGSFLSQSRHLKTEEAQESAFEDASLNLAQGVVRDFFSLAL